MRRVLLSCWLALCVAPWAAAQSLPGHLVGVWAGADAVIGDGGLLGGLAVYLDGDGAGALVAAPLPAGKCDGAACGPRIGIAFQARYDPATGTVTGDSAQLAGTPIVMRYDAGNARLTLQAPDGEHVLSRRAAAVPAAARAELHPVPAR